LTTAEFTVRGTTNDNTAAALNVQKNNNGSLFYVRNDGNVGIVSTNPDFQNAPPRIDAG
jgi:hypothetical protein